MTGTPAQPRERAAAADAAASRYAFVEQLRIALTLAVVVQHVAITYGGAGRWYLVSHVGAFGQDAAATALSLYTAVTQAFALGMLFLLAGFTTPPACDQRGLRGYVVDRLLRYGIPLVVFALLLDPVTVALARAESQAAFFVLVAAQWQKAAWTPGPMWYALVLLGFALAYAGWRQWRPARVVRDVAPLPRHGTLLLLALAVGVATFGVRLVWPVGADLAGVPLASCALYGLLFVAGCIAWRHRWLERVDGGYARPWLVAALVAIVALPLAYLAVQALWPGPVAFDGGWHVAAAVYALWEPFVAWGIILALLVAFRTRIAPGRWQGLGRRAYAVYVLHPPVVVGLARLVAGWPLPDLAKFALVAIAGCALLVVLAGVLLRVPGMRRVL
ncbi:MAG: acyltransferase [Proteobacteria bacterium]|nr:acyltransferase [Pseudomonadota bacterium]